MHPPVQIRPGIGRLLRDLDQAPPTELMEVCAGWLRRHLGATAAVLLLADYGEMSLEPVADGSPSDGMPSQDVVSSPAGVAYREQRRVLSAVEAKAGAGDPVARQVVHLPVSIRTERLGVLTVTLPGSWLGADAVEVLDDVAQVLAYVLTGARRYTDRFEILRRRRDLGLAAEMQWELLPSLAYELPGFSIAGALEPAYEIGGDNFDYAVSAHRLTVSVSDGTGHDVRAGLLASLACTAMRNARRGGAPLAEQAATANRHVAEQFPGPEFVTAVLLELEVASGAGVLVNAGHPPPLLLRAGRVRELAVPPALPLGLSAKTMYVTHPLRLQPGDRLLLITDGVTEAHRPGQAHFGDERVAELLRGTAHLPPPEVVRRLTRTVAEHCAGRLTDDATAVCLDWHPLDR